MTANDTTPATGQESIDVDEWEEIARLSIGTELEKTSEQVKSVARRVGCGVEDGDGPTEEQVKKLRAAIDELECVVEKRLAALCPTTEPYETDGQHLTYDQLADRLGVSLDDVNELRRD